MKKHLKKFAAILMPIALTLAPMAAMAEEAAPAEYYAEEDSWDDQMTIPGEEYDWIDDEEIEDIENVKDLEDWDDFFEEDEFEEDGISDEEPAGDGFDDELLDEGVLVEDETGFDDLEGLD